MADNEKRRISQLEEQLSNTLRAVDKLHLDVEAFKDYAVENNKMVNGILNKMDETQDTMKQLMVEMIEDRKQRNQEINTINRRLERLENQ